MPLPTHFTLNTGAKIPAVGFGTWQAAPHEVEKAVEIALREGQHETRVFLLPVGPLTFGCFRVSRVQAH